MKPGRVQCPACGRPRVRVDANGKMKPHHPPGPGTVNEAGVADGYCPGVSLPQERQ